jgi:enterochelin esterase family protein
MMSTETDTSNSRGLPKVKPRPDLTFYLLLALFLTSPLYAAAKRSAPELIALAASGKPGLPEAIGATFSQSVLKDGRAFAARGGDFFFALESDLPPALVMDEGPPMPMKSIVGSKLWFGVIHTDKVSFDHRFHYVIGGADFGGSFDLPALGPLSYLQPGVLSGTVSEKITHVSKIYDGMKTDYRIYVPAQYDPKIPAALMVFQDGLSDLDRNGNNPILNVIDNLIALKKIPVIICLFVDPGDISGSPGTPTYAFVKKFMKEHNRKMADSMRSAEYDTVSDRYEHFLHDEILAEVDRRYNIRQDAYSRAAMGFSSGGICAFNLAWQAPDDFSRVISWMGSFGAHQWKERPDVFDGGQDFPEKVLRESRRNMRVWLADGSNDLEQIYGSWPLDNIRMANALKMAGYDFHFSFGTGAHSSSYGATQFPEEMIWLWRDYDPAMTQQTYEMEQTEKARPVFRVSITNRDAR